MSERLPGANERRLDAVYERLAATADSGRPLLKNAVLSGVELTLVSTDSGDLLATMTEHQGTTSEKTYMFGSFENGYWAPISAGAGDEQLKKLAELAEQAEWKDQITSD